MNKKIINIEGTKIAIIQSVEPIITDVQSTLDLLSTVGYEDGCERVVINKEGIIDSFFKLSSGIAGEVLQKVVNYRKKLAIIGDFSCYTSKPLHDFIYECNRGNDVFFVETEQKAIKCLLGNRG